MTPSDLSLYHWDTGQQLNPKHYFLAASTNTVTIKRTSNASSARGRSCWKLVCRYLLPSNTGYGKTWCKTWFCRGKKIEQWTKREVFASLTKEKERDGGRKERERQRQRRKKRGKICIQVTPWMVWPPQLHPDSYPARPFQSWPNSQQHENHILILPQPSQPEMRHINEEKAMWQARFCGWHAALAPVRLTCATPGALGHSTLKLTPGWTGGILAPAKERPRSCFSHLNFSFRVKAKKCNLSGAPARMSMLPGSFWLAGPLPPSSGSRGYTKDQPPTVQTLLTCHSSQQISSFATSFARQWVLYFVKIYYTFRLVLY